MLYYAVWENSLIHDKRYVITKHDPIIMCLHVCSYIPVHNGMKNEDSVLTIESLQYI